MLCALTGPRDAAGREGGQTHALTLSYPFSLDEAAEVIPRFPSLQGQLYEAPLGSQLILVFDSRGRMMLCTDVWPENYKKKLPKGKYVLKLRVRRLM